MSYHQYQYDGDVNDLIMVANPTDEDIKVTWGGVPHTVPAGASIPFVRSLAMHITKKVMEREERKRGDKGEKSLRKPETWQKWQDKIMVQVIKEYGDRKNPTEGESVAANNAALTAQLKAQEEHMKAMEKRLNDIDNAKTTGADRGGSSKEVPGKKQGTGRPRKSA